MKNLGLFFLFLLKFIWAIIQSIGVSKVCEMARKTWGEVFS
jgi:hypothetical protein